MLDFFKILKKQKRKIKQLEMEKAELLDEVKNLRQMEYYVRQNATKGAYECIKRRQYERLFVGLK